MAADTHRRLINDINEIEANGLATRTWSGVGLILKECGGCDRFGENGCLLLPMPEYIRRLTTAGEHVCPRQTPVGQDSR
jgi:hypothetical protein